MKFLNRPPFSMKQLNKKKLTLGAGLLAIVAAVILLFQNCADPLDLASEDALSYNNQLPFAFEATVDTLSYMSCSNVPASYESRALFTFRAGAFTSEAGLRLSSAFHAQTGNFSVAQRAQALSESARNRQSILQMAIRPKMQYQSILTASGSNVREGKDYYSLLGELDSPEIAEALSALAVGDWINYFAGVLGLDNRSVEGSLYFLDSETIANSVRTQLNDSGVLTFTYAPGTTGEYAARGPSSGSETAVYGAGFELGFRLPPGRSSGVRRALDDNDIREISLETNSPSGVNMAAWSCPNDLALKIVRVQDLASVTCNREPDSITALSDPNSRLSIIRRILPVEDWYVDTTNNCIVSKHEDDMKCYGSATDVTVVYSTGSACDNGKADLDGDGSLDVTDNTKVCAHYVSVCTRSQ